MPMFKNISFFADFQLYFLFNIPLFFEKQVKLPVFVFWVFVIVFHEYIEFREY